MGLLSNIVKEVIELPGQIVETVAKETIALPARIMDGMSKGMDVALGEDDEEDR